MDVLPLIPLVPAAGALLTGTVGVRAFGKRTTALVACGAMFVAFLLSVWQFASLLALPEGSRERVVTVAEWITPISLQTSHGLASFHVPWALRLDPLSALMILVVSGVGFLIHVYATAYMSEEADGSYARFFCYLNLFVFFMLTLVLGANFVVLFVGWEGVGLCSYLLIGYWYDRDSAANAGKKAFLVNRVGDFGFLLGMFLVFDTFGTLDFRAVANAAAALPIDAGFGTLSLICLLLFIGASGKSAQLPLHVWLPDAMEGPTPVSALIHAATMVTAGVYMVCRNAVLFGHAPIVMQVVATVGLLTALVAASIGLVQTDIKRTLAYSTVSQLGYMFLAAGVGAYAAAIFHLMTHAFFKALLFLGSGSVIHGMSGQQDMRRMGNLRVFLPVTYATMMVGTLAIAGVPPFSGFFSKDEILARAFSHGIAFWTVAAVTAGMTAFYMFRLMALTFFGTYRGDEPSDAAVHGATGAGHGAGHGPHESPALMTIPLVVLAVGAVLAGFVGVPGALGGGNRIEHYLEPSFAAGHARNEAAPDVPGETAPTGHEAGPHAMGLGGELALMAFSVGIAAAGIALAWRMYVRRPELAERAASRWASLHRVLSHKYYFDELYAATFVRGTLGAAFLSWRFDRWVVDGIVNLFGWATRAAAWLSGLADRYGVDGVVNGVGNSLWEASFGYRRLQTGLIQNYALMMVLGVVTLVSMYLFIR